MVALVYPDLSGMERIPATVLPEIICNATLHFGCLDGSCVNRTTQCDGYFDCSDGSDEDMCAEVHPRRKLTPLEVAAIVLGCIIGTVIICCLMGTIIDCFMHVYKYWCSCLHKAYQCPSEMIALRTQNNNPNDPTVLVVRAIPPSYSTILVSCEPSSQVARCRENENQAANNETSTSPTSAAIIATTDLNRINSSTTIGIGDPPATSQDTPATTTTTISVIEYPTLTPNNNNNIQGVSDNSTNTDDDLMINTSAVCTRETSTQTSLSPRDNLSDWSTPFTAQTRTNLLSRLSSRSTSCLFRLPPSYSSLFIGDTPSPPPSMHDSDNLVFHNHQAALVSEDRLNAPVYIGPFSGANRHGAQTTNAEVHTTQGTSTEMVDLSDSGRGGGFVLENLYIKSSKT